MTAECFFHRHTDFPYGCTGARGLDSKAQQVALTGRRRLFQITQRLVTGRLIAFCAGALNTCDLAFADFLVVDLKDVDFILFFQTEFVHADDHLIAAVNRRLIARGCLFDAQFRHARGNRLGHAAHLVDLFDDLPRLFGQIIGQLLDIVRARQRIDDLGHLGLVLQDQLGVARDTGREFGRQRNRLVKRVGMERLRPAQNRRHRLVCRADHVVIGVLFLQADARGLTVGAQHQGFRVLGVELAHDAVPQEARRAQLGDLHEEVGANRKEERQTTRKGIHVQTGFQGGLYVFLTVGKGEGQFLNKVRARLLHVIARDRDRIEFRHIGRGVFDDIRDDPHRGFGRIDIGVAHHELFQNVVLNGARQQLAINALLFAGDDKVRKDRDHRAVHGHRHRHLVKRDAVKQDFHVLDTVDGDARLTDVTDNALVITVVATVRGKVKGDRHTLLTGGQGLAVKGVGFLSRGETGVLADGPRTTGVHGRLGATGERGKPRHFTHMRQVLDVVLGVHRFDGDAFGRVPVQRVKRFAAQLFLGQRTPCLCLIRHGISPFLTSRAG